jgi:uncharacterized protein
MVVLIDTNIWVSALINASMRLRIQRILADERIILLADAELLGELTDVCNRSKITRLVTLQLIEAFLQLIRERMTMIEPRSQFEVCKDADDDFLLAICYDGEADYLLTGDKELLAIGQFMHTQVKTLSDFESIVYGVDPQ